MKSVNKILSSEMSKSKKMIELYLLGKEIKEISVLMEVRYNFVYNVVSNYCNVNEVELRSKKKEVSKKDLIIKMFEEGKSNKEISIELKSNYNYVFNVIKKYKLEKEVV